MGIISQDFNPWLRSRFPQIFVDPLRSGVRNDAVVLIIDGSLFIRSVRQWTGTWAEVLIELCSRLDNLLSEFPALEVLVFRIDAYGGDHVIQCKAKDACHAKRYSEAPPLPDGLHPDELYQPCSKCDGITQEMTFGHMANRIAFNAMVSRALFAWAKRVCRVHNNGTLSVILEGVVHGRAVTSSPIIVCAQDDDATGQKVAVHGDFKFPDHIPGPCMHSEGDIGLVFWTQFFSNLATVVYSCDTDLLIALLFHMRRMSESGIEYSKVPPLTLYKVVPLASYYIDIKLAFLIIFAAFAQHHATAHPIEVFAFLYTCCGNDFCQPYCNSEEKDNGIRFPAVLAAYEKYSAEIGPLFEMPHSGAPLYTYGEQRFQTIQYTARIHTERVRALMIGAADLQAKYDSLKAVAKKELLFDNAYFNAQVARCSWTIGYYANAGVPGLAYARGDEVSERTGKSLHGWAYTAKKELLRTSDVHCSYVHANGDETLPPTPIDVQLHEKAISAHGDATQKLLTNFKQYASSQDKRGVVLSSLVYGK